MQKKQFILTLTMEIAKAGLRFRPFFAEDVASLAIEVAEAIETKYREQYGESIFKPRI